MASVNLHNFVELFKVHKVDGKTLVAMDEKQLQVKNYPTTSSAMTYYIL